MPYGELLVHSEPIEQFLSIVHHPHIRTNSNYLPQMMIDNQNKLMRLIKDWLNQLKNWILKKLCDPIAIRTIWSFLSIDLPKFAYHLKNLPYLGIDLALFVVLATAFFSLIAYSQYHSQDKTAILSEVKNHTAKSICTYLVWTLGFALLLKCSFFSLGLLPLGILALALMVGVAACFINWIIHRRDESKDLKHYLRVFTGAFVETAVRASLVVFFSGALVGLASLIVASVVTVGLVFAAGCFASRAAKKNARPDDPLLPNSRGSQDSPAISPNYPVRGG